MTHAKPTINDILESFFLAQKAGVHPDLAKRIDAVEYRLRDCIETEAFRILEDSDAHTLRQEREVRPEGAVARLMHADDLIFLLSIFVEPKWRPLESAQRAIHFALTDQLARFMVDRNLVDRHELSCPLLDIAVAVDGNRSGWRRQLTQGRRWESDVS